MRYIRGSFFALTSVLILLSSAQAQSVSIGQTSVLSGGDSGNGNLLLAQSATLAQAATVQSLSFYVTAASGKLILGIYDATGPNGGPGALKASTASFSPVTGWNTANVITPVSLTAGSYWLAYLPSSNGLGFRKTNASGNCEMYGHKFGSLPSKFSASPNSCTPTTWSFYATLTPASGGGATAVNGACGSSNGADLTSAPTTNLCNAGTATSVTGSGPWNWACAGSNGGTTTTCEALDPPAPVNGACGSANGVAASTAPTSGLCTTGSASAVSGSGPWNWSCAGSNGGSTTTCSDSLNSASGGSGGGGNVALTALHTYYISPTGSDSNNGTSSSTPWATPNHPVNCGDIIIAEAGTYSAGQFGEGNWGTVSNCPSTSGGIDGAGGIYFATILCAGPDLMSCKANSNDYAFWVTKSNWAIESFWATSPIQNEICFLGDNGNTGGTALHHIAFINDIASTCGDAGFATSGGGSATGSFDQTAVVGVVAWSAANSQTSGGECGSGVSIIPAIGSDSSAGTHIYYRWRLPQQQHRSTRQPWMPSWHWPF